MTAIKRKELLKELSGKLRDQIAPPPNRIFGTLPDSSGVLRPEVLRNRRTLYERSMTFTDETIPKPER